jgi:hypothetical protein
MNQFNTGNGWTNVSGTALSATNRMHQLLVNGSSNDSLALSAGNGYWYSAGTVSNGGTNFTVYQNDQGNSQVLVQSNMNVTNNDSTPMAGDAVIDLGTYGKLIAPVQVEGKVVLLLGPVRGWYRCRHGLAQRWGGLRHHGLAEADILWYERWHSYHREQSVLYHQRHQCGAAYRR